MRNYLLLLLLLPVICFAQGKNKIEKQSFCGWRLSDKEKIKTNFREQFDFLNVHDGDTIVDIGAQSGGYEGCFLAANEINNISFVLVDIDSLCMNQRKIDSMIAYYSRVKGEPIKANFKLVHNTADSLWLPEGQYERAWIMNTLHEIPDKAKMVRDINLILKPRGEIVVLELGPRKGGQLHGGCNKPLMNLSEINSIFNSNGFLPADQKALKNKKHFDILLLRFIKE